MYKYVRIYTQSECLWIEQYISILKRNKDKKRTLFHLYLGFRRSNDHTHSFHPTIWIHLSRTLCFIFLLKLLKFMLIRIMFLFLFLHITTDRSFNPLMYQSKIQKFFYSIFLFSIFLNEQILKKKIVLCKKV